MTIATAPWILGCLIVTAVAGCASRDSIFQTFDVKSGQPIPTALPNPETWVCLGTKTIENRMQRQVWVKPAQMNPRQYQHGDLSDADMVKVGVLLYKPLENYPNEWTELFEYQDLPRPAVSPQKYLDRLKEQQLRDCPSGSITPIRVTSTELLLEMESGGCERFGNQHEIVRFLFGNTDLFHMIYTVKSREMTPEQREIGIKAVGSWNMDH